MLIKKIYIIYLFFIIFGINVLADYSTSLQQNEFKKHILHLKEKSDFIGIVKLKKIKENLLMVSKESMLDTLGFYFFMKIKIILNENLIDNNLILFLNADDMCSTSSIKWIGSFDGTKKNIENLFLFLEKIPTPKNAKKEYKYYKSSFACYLEGENNTFTNRYINKLIGEDLKLVKDDFILAMKYFILDKDKNIKLTPKAKEIYEKIFEYEKIEKLQLKDIVDNEKLSEKEKGKKIRSFFIKKGYHHKLPMQMLKDNDFILAIKYYIAEDKAKMKKLQYQAKMIYKFIWGKGEIFNSDRP